MNAETTDHEAVWTTLGNPTQIERETRALRICASEPVQTARRDLELLYEQDPTADLPSARETLKSAVAAMTMGGALGAVNKDVDRPAILWGSSAAHRWHGLDVPASGIALDNPDNVYRSVLIDGAAKYEITGKITPPAPAQQTFVLYDVSPGSDDGEVKEHLDELGTVVLDRVPLDADGAFTITVDNSATEGRTNHLQTSSQSRQMHILIRDTLSDWETQNPVQISINRLSGPPVAPPLSDAEVEAAAAKHIRQNGKYWLAWGNRVFFSRPVNTFSLNFARTGGWGATKAGQYRLADDEALVVTVERRGAEYFAYQLANVWGPAVEYINRTGSLNQGQARPNNDGSYTVVVAAYDPGVHNWLDPGGLSAGQFQVRWQQVPADFTDEGSVTELKVVKLANLKSELRPETTWITSEGRRAQLARRAESYMRRIRV